ncbi:peptidoglycan-associated lipoprotein Pal [Massilia genomosp. 1]|uniref:Peptidoglycan-associated lipoprotein n=1 Tax=Massilia genomosp. 1 TaxID=2609280 RepID=A0ABX0MQJ3_9BURK|nr:peptidoglycan-associated lipoprotein Pal [Massilia genomosp. 1]NHZ64347.1 peptidoglycan-associated lipoprotein Pal [Massilia genomosp. 1]
MRNFKTLAFIVSSAALLTACNTPVKDTPVPVTEKPVAGKTVVTDDTREVKTQTTESVVDPVNDPSGALAKRSVYFDLDSYVVREDGKPIVENHAGYLTKNKTRKIIIQGNTDERGGTEYNLALGQKRAEAVRKSMASLGVSESQMEAVSLGEEKPKATGGGEAAWAENRRADIVY